jgi:hypothetical protein
MKTGLAGRGVDLAFGVWTDGIGEARDGSHEAERMSRPI